MPCLASVQPLKKGKKLNLTLLNCTGLVKVKQEREVLNEEMTMQFETFLLNTYLYCPILSLILSGIQTYGEITPNTTFMSSIASIKDDNIIVVGLIISSSAF